MTQTKGHNGFITPNQKAIKAQYRVGAAAAGETLFCLKLLKKGQLAQVQDYVAGDTFWQGDMFDADRTLWRVVRVGKYFNLKDGHGTWPHQFVIAAPVEA